MSFDLFILFHYYYYYLYFVYLFYFIIAWNEFLFIYLLNLIISCLCRKLTKWTTIGASLEGRNFQRILEKLFRRDVIFFFWERWITKTVWHKNKKIKKCSMYKDEMWAMFREERVLVSCLPMLVESMSGKERSWTWKRKRERIFSTWGRWMRGG